MARRTRNAARAGRSTDERSTSRRSPGAKPKARSAASGRKSEGAVRPALRRLDDTFEERRFEATASGRQYLGVILMSLGAIALGAGVYAVFFRADDAPPIAWAPWLLAAGAVLLIVYFILGQAGQPSLRVGELGLGVEEGERIQRTAWYQIEKIAMSGGSLTVKPPGAAIVLPLAAHGSAAKRLVDEAMKRIPDRVELDEGELGAIAAAGTDEGEGVLAEPPQVTEMLCAASERPLTFERDVRMCGRCGILYHRQAVPARCVGCARKLRKAI